MALSRPSTRVRKYVAILTLAMLTPPLIRAQGPTREMWKAPNNKTYVVSTMGGGKMFMFSEQGVGNLFIHTTSGDNRIITQGAITQADADELMKAYLVHTNGGSVGAVASPAVPAGGNPPAAATPVPSRITSVALDCNGDLVAQTNEGPQTFRHDGKRMDISYTDMTNARHIARLELKSAGSQAATALATATLTGGNKGTFTGNSWVVVTCDGDNGLAISLKKGYDVGFAANKADKAIIIPVQNHKALLQEALDKAKSDPATAGVANKFGTLNF